MTELQFNEEQLEHLKNAISKRAGREDPEILVVEDDQFSRGVILGALRQEYSYKCHGAENVSDALEYYCNYAPEIVFLDVTLPDGNGHDLAKLFGRSDPNSFICMVTGSTEQEDLGAAKDNNVKRYIVKPFELDKIVACIDLYKSDQPEKLDNQESQEDVSVPAEDTTPEPSPAAPAEDEVSSSQE